MASSGGDDEKKNPKIKKIQLLGDSNHKGKTVEGCCCVLLGRADVRLERSVRVIRGLR